MGVSRPLSRVAKVLRCRGGEARWWTFFDPKNQRTLVAISPRLPIWIIWRRLVVGLAWLGGDGHPAHRPVPKQGCCAVQGSVEQHDQPQTVLINARSPTTTGQRSLRPSCCYLLPSPYSWNRVSA